jgi:hypothetical protein
MKAIRQGHNSGLVVQAHHLRVLPVGVTDGLTPSMSPPLRGAVDKYLYRETNGLAVCILVLQSIVTLDNYYYTLSLIPCLIYCRINWPPVNPPTLSLN